VRRAYAGGMGIALALALLGVSGCVATAQSAPPRGVLVNGPPPPPLTEDRPPPPRPQERAQWIAGYWHWTGMQYAWIPGHWESSQPGATWTPPRYMAADGAYFYEPGGWKGNAAAVPGHANALR